MRVKHILKVIGLLTSPVWLPILIFINERPKGLFDTIALTISCILIYIILFLFESYLMFGDLKGNV